MPKTYNTFTNVSTGDVLTATNFNNVLTNVGNYRVPPACRVFRAAAGTHTSTGNFQAITFDTQSLDTEEPSDNMWVVGSATRITFKTAGVYQVGGIATFAFNTSGFRAAVIRLNGTTDIARHDQGSAPAAAINVGLLPHTLYSFAVNDYIELLAFQSSGGNLAYSVGTDQLNLYAAWAGQAS
jgi:hypothetical protein